MWKRPGQLSEPRKPKREALLGTNHQKSARIGEIFCQTNTLAKPNTSSLGSYSQQYSPHKGVALVEQQHLAMTVWCG